MPSHTKSMRASRIRGALLGFVAGSAAIAALWGFCVDDALISARVAHQLATGHGYRFNADGPVVDAVTPLGYAPLLAPFARSSTLAAFRAARVVGAAAALAAASLLGARVASEGSRPIRFAPLFLLAISAPFGAWASSGMETPLVLLLATVALGRGPLAVLAAGLAAAWRPELLPWAIVLGVGGELARTLRPGPALLGLGLALAPAFGVAVVRSAVFGSAMPLSAVAKPALASEGSSYALGAAVFTGLPLLVLAPFWLRKLERRHIVVLAASLAHLPAVALAGGDWMPLYRLVVPVLPGFVLVGAALAERAPIWASAVRVALALAASAVLLAGLGASSRHVYAQRSELMRAARQPLAGSARIASVDVGWVGALGEAHVIDLAGVTDPRVARLAGGHTSRHFPDDFLEREHADAVLALFDAGRGDWFRASDGRIAAQAEGLGFARTAELPLSESSLRYVVFRRP